MFNLIGCHYSIYYVYFVSYQIVMLFVYSLNITLKTIIITINYYYSLPINNNEILLDSFFNIFIQNCYWFINNFYITMNLIYTIVFVFILFKLKKLLPISIKSKFINNKITVNTQNNNNNKLNKVNIF